MPKSLTALPKEPSPKEPSPKEPSLNEPSFKEPSLKGPNDLSLADNATELNNKNRPNNHLVRLIKALWLFAGRLDLAIYICFFLALDTAIAYPFIQKSLFAFIPLGEVGLWTWLFTYGRAYFSQTFWFYGLALGLILLGINTFVCSTTRVLAIIKPQNRQRGWFLKLGPHVTHYAVLVMVLGYLGSYALAEALPGRALIPGGPAYKLPKNLGRLTATIETPKVYQGQRLLFFQNWYLDPGIVLRFEKPGGQTYAAPIAYNRPVHYQGYNFYLTDFYPKSADGAMGSYRMAQLTIRRDPAAAVYVAGIIVFAVGLTMYVADLIQSRLFARPKP